MKWQTGMLALVAGGACLAIASPALSKAVVVRSAGPSAKTYPPGKALPEGVSVVQPARRLMVSRSSTVTVPGCRPWSKAIRVSTVWRKAPSLFSLC